MARSEKGFQPLLASPVEGAVKFPVYGSPKLNGIRCIIRDGVALSRKLKPIPNAYVQQRLKGLPDGLDGELIVGATTATDVWNRSQSGVMSETGVPDFRFWLFDIVSDCIFSARFNDLARIVETYQDVHPIGLVSQRLLETQEELIDLEKLYVDDLGYEGVMLRSRDGKYKYGKSTNKEGYLLKWKRFFDTEAEVTGYVERMKNNNTQERDERGYAKRSKAKAGLVGCDTLGALKCRTGVWPDGSCGLPKEGVPVGEREWVDFGEMEWVDFEIGSGFTDADRAALWARRYTTLVGSIHKFKYQVLTPKKIPLLPVWLGERDGRDM